MMKAERSIRLDFLTFDYEDYLIHFEKGENINNSILMVTASGGAKGHHGTINNPYFIIMKIIILIQK